MGASLCTYKILDTTNNRLLLTVDASSERGAILAARRAGIHASYIMAVLVFVGFGFEAGAL